MQKFLCLRFFSSYFHFNYVSLFNVIFLNVVRSCKKKKKNHAFLGVLRLGFRGPLRLSAPWAFKNTGHVILVLSACFPTKELFNDVNVTG